MKVACAFFLGSILTAIPILHIETQRLQEDARLWRTAKETAIKQLAAMEELEAEVLLLRHAVSGSCTVQTTWREMP